MQLLTAFQKVVHACDVSIHRKHKNSSNHAHDDRYAQLRRFALDRANTRMEMNVGNTMNGSSGGNDGDGGG